MDIVVTGRHLTVSDRFRAHIEEKLEKVTQLEPRTRRPATSAHYGRVTWS